MCRNNLAAGKSNSNPDPLRWMRLGWDGVVPPPSHAQLCRWQGSHTSKECPNMPTKSAGKYHQNYPCLKWGILDAVLYQHRICWIPSWPCFCHHVTAMGLIQVSLLHQPGSKEVISPLPPFFPCSHKWRGWRWGGGCAICHCWPATWSSVFIIMFHNGKNEVFCFREGTIIILFACLFLILNTKVLCKCGVYLTKACTRGIKRSYIRPLN